MAILLFITYSLLVGLILYPQVRRRSPEMFDFLYAWQDDFQELKGNRRRVLKFASDRVERIVPRKLLGRFDRFLRLAGYPHGLGAGEVLSLYIGIFLLCALLSPQMEKTSAQMFALGIMGPLAHWNMMRGKKNRRQLYAAEAIRLLKRRFVYLLRSGIDVVQALQLISAYAPGEFGDVFRKHVTQLSGKDQSHSLRDAMRNFRAEYEVKTLDDFCYSIELSEQKSPSTLADQIYRQMFEENSRLDEFIEKKSEDTKGKMIGLVALAAVWTLAFVCIFAFVTFLDYFRGGGGFLNF